MDADGGDDDDQGMLSFWFGGEDELLILHPSEKLVWVVILLSTSI